jgi:hypothetical protein
VYDLCYMIDFSKVKNVEHAGKELGFMQVFEKVTASLSPLIGGLVAYMFGVEVTIWLSAILFALASWPLLSSAEQTKTRQKLAIRGFPWKGTWRSMRAETALGFDVVASTMVWILFIALTVFAGSGDDLYLKIGALTSVTIITSFVIAFVFGRLIDRKRGGDLLRFSVIANALTHTIRPFVTTPIGVATTNIINETATTGYAMAFTRGLFDMADLSGRRITYMLFVEIALNVGSAIACIVFACCLMLLPDDSVLAMQIFFGIAAVYVLLVASAKFPLYRNMS